MSGTLPGRGSAAAGFYSNRSIKLRIFTQTQARRDRRDRRDSQGPWQGPHCAVPCPIFPFAGITNTPVASAVNRPSA